MRKFIWIMLVLLLSGCGSTGSSSTEAAAPSSSESVTAKVESAGIELREGWNPFAFQCVRIESLQGFERVLGVAYLEGGEYRVRPATLATLQELGGRRGYWLYADRDTTVRYTGSDDDRTPQLPVAAGWSLVSFGCTYSIRTADVSPRDILLYQVGPDGSPRAVDTLEPGKPCWVYAREATTLRWTVPLTGLDLTPSTTVLRLLGAHQLELRAKLPDGSTANVTELAAWTSQDPARAGLSQTGVVTGLSKGMVNITARFQGQEATAAVNVIDPADPTNGGEPSAGGGGGGGAPPPVATPTPSPSPSPSPSPAIERRNVSSAGAQANAETYVPSTSTDGRYIVFPSDATNLVADDSNGAVDIFRHDRQTGTTIRVSTTSAGAQRIVPVEEDGMTADVSGDGRYVVFNSSSTNFVADDLNDSPDVFVKDCQTGAVALVSADAAGAQGEFSAMEQTISQDGTWIAFISDSSNLVSGDTPEGWDLFLKNRVTGAILAATLSANDSPHNPSLSADGGVCAFDSPATNLVGGDTNNESDIFIHDVGDGTVRVGGSGGSFNPQVSEDGRYVAFESDAPNLVAGDTNGARDVFVYDTVTTSITRIAERASRPSWSPDGRYLAFETGDALVVADTNGLNDIYLYDRTGGSFARACSTLTNGGSVRAVVGTGWVTFLSEATNLVTGDTNALADIFSAPFP